MFNWLGLTEVFGLLFGVPGYALAPTFFRAGSCSSFGYGSASAPSA